MPVLQHYVDSLDTFYYFIWYCSECEGWHIESNDPEIDSSWIYESAAAAAYDIV